jgi:hypothetical protein
LRAGCLGKKMGSLNESTRHFIGELFNERKKNGEMNITEKRGIEKQSPVLNFMQTLMYQHFSGLPVIK